MTTHQLYGDNTQWFSIWLRIIFVKPAKTWTCKTGTKWYLCLRSSITMMSTCGSLTDWSFRMPNRTTTRELTLCVSSGKTLWLPSIQWVSLTMTKSRSTCASKKVSNSRQAMIRSSQWQQPATVKMKRSYRRRLQIESIRWKCGWRSERKVMMMRWRSNRIILSKLSNQTPKWLSIC